MAAPLAERPGARAHDRLARLRRQRRRAPERLRRLRSARPAGRHGARPRHEGEAEPRGGDCARGRRSGSAPRRGACVHYPAVRRLPLPGSRVRSAARSEGLRRSRRARADRRLSGFELEPAVPAESIFHYRNKLEYSFTETGVGSALGFHKAGRWDEVLDIDKLLADDRPRQRDSQRGPGLGARRRARRRTTRRPRRATSATSSSVRAGTPARCSSLLVTAPGDAPPRSASSRRCGRSPRCARSTGRSTTLPRRSRTSGRLLG